MKTHASVGIWVVSLAMAVTAATVYAAQAVDKAAERAEMEKCFKEHGALMSKPALTNIYDCWRAHSYLYRANR